MDFSSATTFHSAGDVNSDELDDLIVGSPFDEVRDSLTPNIAPLDYSMLSTVHQAWSNQDLPDPPEKRSSS